MKMKVSMCFIISIENFCLTFVWLHSVKKSFIWLHNIIKLTIRNFIHAPSSCDRHWNFTKCYILHWYKTSVWVSRPLEVFIAVHEDVKTLPWHADGSYLPHSLYQSMTNSHKCKQNKKVFNHAKKKNFKLYDPFYGWGLTASRIASLRGGILLFNTKFSEIPGTHFIDLGRMKDWVDLGVPQMFWTWVPWIVQNKNQRSIIVTC